jgi:hypothetical protein
VLAREPAGVFPYLVFQRDQHQVQPTRGERPAELGAETLAATDDDRPRAVTAGKHAGMIHYQRHAASRSASSR